MATSKDSGCSTSGVIQRCLIPRPPVLTSFDVCFAYPCIACVYQGLAWVLTGYRTLQLVDREGHVKDTVNVDFAIYDMTVTPDGDVLLCDHNGSCIKLLSKDNKINTLFKTNSRPSGVCCLSNKDIVVTFSLDSKVVIYNVQGQVRKTLEYKFRFPLKVAANKVNQDIYVCDHEAEFFYSFGKVLAFRSDGQLRYQYSGQCDEHFCPVEVCTDYTGHVLLTDHNKHRVHILDQEGRFIQYVQSSDHGLHQPATLDSDGEGLVWVGERIRAFQGRVKVIKYSELSLENFW